MSKVEYATVGIDFLSGVALDYAAVKAQGKETTENGLEMWIMATDGTKTPYKGNVPPYSKSIPWAWSILENLRIEYRVLGDRVQASFVGGDRWVGDDYIEAGLRCFVASKFPNGLIEIPANLLGV